MKITDVRIIRERVTLKKPFRVSLGVIDEYYTMLIKIITDEEIFGVGEGSPLGMITGETIEGTLAVAQLFKENLIGTDPLNIPEAHRRMDELIYGNPSAKTAFDTALYDISAKKAGLPLYRFLGGSNRVVINDITLGMDTRDVMLREAEEHVKAGFQRLKIKVGGAIEKDIDNVRAIRRVVGEHIHLYLDANQGWTTAQTIQAIHELKDCNIASIEQPVPRWDIEGLIEIRKAVNIPVIADEAVFSTYDAMNVIRHQAVDGINIKLMKCGGIFHAMGISRFAHEAGVFCMVGCMMDTVIGITAAASFAAADDNVKIADLDSVFHIKGNGIISNVQFEKGTVILSEKPGLDVDFSCEQDNL